MDYKIAYDWLISSGITSGIDVMCGIYREPEATSRGICIVPTGGSLPSDVNNEVLCSFYFTSSENDDFEQAENLVRDVIEHSRCNYQFDRYSVQATTTTPRPFLTNGNRFVWEVGFRIL